MWWPFHAEPADLVLRWCMDSYGVFKELAEDEATGVVMRHGTFGFPAASIPQWASAIPEAILATQLPHDCASGVDAVAPMIEMNRYMPWLMETLEGIGVDVVQHTVTSLDDVDSPVIINTSGLGARELCNDESVVAVRGRVVVLKQNGLERFSGSEAGAWPAHVFPREHDIVVGGTYEVDNEDIEASNDFDNEIVARATLLEPAIHGAARITAKSGFRPSRPTVRLETEVRGGKTIVHNYGRRWWRHPVVGLCERRLSTCGIRRSLKRSSDALHDFGGSRDHFHHCAGWPQVSRIAVHKHTNGVSTASWTMMFLTNIVWIEVGVAANVFAIIFANVLSAVAAFCVLLQIAHHSDYRVRNTIALAVVVAIAGAFFAYIDLRIVLSVALSVIAAIMTLPQLVKAFKTDPSAVSAISWALAVGSSSTWSVYYVTIGKGILMLPNLVICPVSLLILGRVLYKRRSTVLTGTPALLPE
jgi:D-amino-acid oxidase